MHHGRWTGVGTLKTAFLGGQYNCTCIMNPTNVTGYVTDSNKTQWNNLLFLCTAVVYSYQSGAQNRHKSSLLSPSNHRTGAEEQTGGRAGGRGGQMAIGQLGGGE